MQGERTQGDGSSDRRQRDGVERRQRDAFAAVLLRPEVQHLPTSLA
jgi:hypothetical protein